MLIDTHCHLNFKDFENDRDEIIGRCLNPLIKASTELSRMSSPQVWLINVGVDYETSKKAVEIAQKYDKGVYAAVALHPHNVDKEEFDKNKFKKLAKKSKVVAIGETGLDYMFCENDKKIQELQKKVFIKHLELAKKLNKPVIIHCRRLFPEILEILKIYHPKLKTKGVLHCYMGRWSYAQQYLEMGFYIGLNGLITYARDYDKVIRNTPLERILIETDAPYLTPIPHRGERNLPQYVKYVAEKIAEIKKISFEKVADQTTKNARKLFKI